MTEKTMKFVKCDLQHEEKIMTEQDIERYRRGPRQFYKKNMAENNKPRTETGTEQSIENLRENTSERC